MKSTITPKAHETPEATPHSEARVFYASTQPDLSAVKTRFRTMDAKLNASADAAWLRFQQTGAAIPAAAVIAEMRNKIQARRLELQFKAKSDPNGESSQVKHHPGDA